MSLAIQGSLQQGAVMLGQNGRKLQWGNFAFSTTDASGSLPLNLRRLESLVITPAGTPAADEVVSGPAIPAGGSLAIPAAGTVTITRTGASKTSGLVCSYLAIGF